MYGLWVVEFGATAAEFWDVWLDDWIAIYDVWLDRQGRDYAIGGTVAAAIANSNRRRGARAYGPDDIFPHLKQLRPVPTEEQLRAKLIAAFGGKPPDPLE